jgi:hypothetical protein
MPNESREVNFRLSGRGGMERTYSIIDGELLMSKGVVDYAAEEGG